MVFRFQRQFSFQLLNSKYYLGKKSSMLIIAIWILVFFSILSLASYKIASSQIDLAKKINQRISAQYLAKAICLYVQTRMQNDNTDYDTFYELGGDIDRDFGFGKVSCKIVDEGAKININIASPKILENIEGFDQEIAKAIIDSQFRPFNIKEELLLLNEITQDSFMQSKDYITVYGKGAVNINTVSLGILKILGMDQDLIKIIDNYRLGLDGAWATEDDGIFENTGSIINNLREFTGLFHKQEILIFSLISKGILGVTSEVLSLEITTEINNNLAVKYIVIIDEDGIKKWIE